MLLLIALTTDVSAQVQTPPAPTGTPAIPPPPVVPPPAVVPPSQPAVVPAVPDAGAVPVAPAVVPVAAPGSPEVPGPEAVAADGNQPAVVTAANVLVRGQASIFSEVVARLKRGDKVVVLEDITLDKTREGNPTQWARIALPPETAVWVHSGYIDPATKKVTPSRLNVRSGPGENYSVLGRIEQGTVVKDLEAQGIWLKIAPTPNLYAFVASHLVGRAEAPSPGGTPAPAPVSPAPPVEVAVVPPPPAPPAQTPPAPEPVEVAVVPAPAVVPVDAPPASAEALSVPPAPVPPALEEIPVPPASEPLEPEPTQLMKRIVSREGIVRRSLSIQAPTEFVLENEENRKTVNYLLPSPGKKITLRGFEGQRILVTGEELIDVRWPNTPVLNIDSIRNRP